MEDLIRKIEELKKEKDAVIVAHNYQRGEIQDIADYTGDSLYLARVVRDLPNETVILAGVYFMAETAAILSPEKKILIPRIDASCPLAEMITAEDVKNIRKQYPEYSIVTYVNSTAEIKAESDICCTSANAVNVVESLPSQKVYFTPDRNLARWVKKHSSKEILWWDGFCPVHRRVKREEVEALKKQYPDAKFVAHPECEPDVLELADHVCSTSGLYPYAREVDASVIIVGTEEGVLHRLKKENPDKTFILASRGLICPNMKKTTLEDIYNALLKDQYRVTVPEEIRVRALAAVEKMAQIS